MTHNRRDPRSWLSWWRNRVSFEARSAATVVAVGFLGLAGYFAAAGLLGRVGPTADADASLVETLTVRRVVTLSGGGLRTVVRPVRVVRGVTRTSSVLATAMELLTVTTPGKTERTLVPVLRRDLVTVAGRPQTVVETRGGTTRTSVVTSERVVTHEREITAERTVEQPVTTTRVVTEAVPVTQTLRSTDTVSVTNTVTEPVTVTVELPVTVTVTVPPGKTK